MTGLRRIRLCWHAESGQSLIEFALILPFLLVLVFGVIDICAELLDVHVVTRLSREGSNMISRDTTLQDATTALKLMKSGPVDFDNGTSKLILSVFKKVATTGRGELRQGGAVSARRVWRAAECQRVGDGWSRFVRRRARLHRA